MPTIGIDFGVAEARAAIADIHTRKEIFTTALARVASDADADSVRRRGRHLPPPTAGGDQLPLVGVQVTRRLGVPEAGDVDTVVVPPADVPWQNLANHLELVRARGLDELNYAEQQLNDLIFAFEHRGGGPTPSGPREDPGKNPQKVYPWVDFITDIIAYVAIFYGMVAAAHAVGFFTIFIVFALLALTGLLNSVIIQPIRAAIRTVFHAILQIIQDLIDFVKTFVEGILQYFQGDFIRAVLQILEVAAFMFIWRFATRIPVIGQLIQFITDAVARAIQFVNDLFDQAIKFIERLRRDVEANIAQVFKGMDDLGKVLTQTMNQLIDHLAAGIESRLQTLRFALIRQIDFVSAALSSTITAFGFKLQLVPEEVRVYLRRRLQAKPTEAFLDTADLVARAGPGFATAGLVIFPPWKLVAELEVQMNSIRVGVDHEVERSVQVMLGQMALLLAGGTPSVPDLPEALRKWQLPETQPPPTSPPPSRPAWVPVGDWEAVRGICGDDHIAYLAAAIGQHETGWGLLGAGRDGFILGVGVFGGVEQEQFRGLVNQLDWACPRLRSAFPGAGDVTRDGVIAFGRDVYRVPDPQSWGEDVFNLFASVYFAPGVRGA